MSIQDLYDHAVVIYRPPSTTQRDAAGGNISQPTALPVLRAGNNAKVTPPLGDMLVQGFGDQPVGRWSLSMDAGTDIQERDLVEIVSGPEAGRVLRVAGPPTHPRGHHMHAHCDLWTQPIGAAA